VFLLKRRELASLIEQFLELEAALKRVELGVFPRYTQRKAVESLISLVRNLTSSLEYLSSSDSAMFLIEKGYGVLQAIYGLIEKIERSNVHYTPLGAVYLAEYLAEKVGRRVIPIICFQSSTSSHTRLSDLLRLVAPLLPPGSQELKEEVIFITLPYFLKNDPLFHCLIAHELALHMMESMGSLEGILTKVASKQLLVLAADRLATLMIGPSYLFTLLNLNMPSSVEEERIRSIASLLLDEGYYEEKLLDGLLPPLAKAHPLADLDQICEVEGYLRKTNAYYSHETFEREVPQLVSRLLELLPPNEVNLHDTGTRPAEIPSIINAGWIVRLQSMPAIYEILKAQKPEEKYQARKKFNALIEKAIELSVIHKSLLEAEV